MKDLSLYIHIPFCVSKCYYCDFVSFTNSDKKIDEYIDALMIELKLYKERLMDYKIKTIFIGGGTPSIINPYQIEKVLQYINENYNVDSLDEVSIEANPGTLSREKLKIYAHSGINRISLGVQSLNDDILKSIGRIHTSKDFYKSINLIREVGIKNINADLIFGLPNQSLQDSLDSLKKIIQLDLNHISYYGLILEEGTKLHDSFDRQEITLPSETEERDMYHNIVEVLKKSGYNHYEISNFSLPGDECKHNLVYWDVKPYLGIGLNSHSNMKKKRFFNTSKIDEYIFNLNKGRLPIVEEEIIDKKREMEEFCILGLRKLMGINKDEFKNRFSIDINDVYGCEIKKHIKNGLIKNNKDSIYLTRRGLDLSNIVEVDFLK